MLKDSLLKLIEIAKVLGLGEQDLKNARDFLIHTEFGLCFETIVTQMYEYGIEIDNDFYKLIVEIAERMNLKQESYFFMKELIRDRDITPEAIKDEL